MSAAPARCSPPLRVHAELLQMGIGHQLCMHEVYAANLVQEICFFLDPGAAMAEMLVEVSDRPGVRFLRKPMKLTISESLVYQLCVRGCMLCCVLGMVCGG